MATVHLLNRGRQVIHMPLLPVITGQPMVKVKLKKLDGAEPVTYPHEGGPVWDLEGRPPSWPALLAFPPNTETVLPTAPFVLWEPGEYSYEFESENRITNRLDWAKPTHGIPRMAITPIPNVWEGRLVFSGRCTVEMSEDGPPGEVEETLNRLRDAALNTRRPLGKRCTALTALVDMRHVYATNVLTEIEKAARTDGVFHLFAVKALYDMACCGTGYRSLAVFAELAMDAAQSVPVRVLCVDALLEFARRTDLRHGGRVIHVITTEEKQAARQAVEKLRANADQLPQEIRGLLRSAEPE
jgi:hypothetical protein